ncbi:hypothetical protein [Promicromonospora sp. NPDC057488]|uniref:hypothetical protein n=1 Tax=Promicromonospora sp. NPDC057488 TaxID=3346147 RepID=UPI00366C4F0C
MSREITILAPRTVTDLELVESAYGVDPELGLRRVNPGAMIQFLRDDKDVVLTVLQPSYLRAPDEIDRMLPGADVAAAVREAARRATADPAAAQPVWIEALAPWDEHGETGARICRAVAAAVGGTCVVQDGR